MDRGRRAGRVALAAAALLLAALIGGLWAVPALLDWNRYRDSIAALATTAIGRPVRIGGAVTLHLLPQPILTASGIAVEDTGDGVVLTAQELRLRVGLGPLLAGNIDARDLVLSGADLRLPWPPAPGALAQRPPSWLTGLQARVEDSRIEVGGLAVTRIDAALQTDPDTGSLSAAGMGQVGARPWRFTARLTRPGRDGAAGLDISLDGEGPLRDTGGTFSGQLGGDGSLAGRVTGRGPDLSKLLPGPAVAWRGDGRLSAAGGLAVADELALELAGSPARGAVALRVLPSARLDVAIAAGRLDLDSWLPVLMRGTEAAMPTGIDLSAEAATLAGGTLRRLRGAFDLDVDGVTARDVSVLLPGDAQLTLSGRLAARPRVSFEGTGRIVAPDLRTTLRWLEPLVPAMPRLPAGVLRTADLSGKVSAALGQASVSDLRGALDGDGLTGGMALRLGPRLSIGAGLSFDRLTLDPWMPNLPALGTAAGAAEALARALAVDADLHLQAKAASWHGVPLGPVNFDGQSEAARLTLRRLEAGPLGMRLTASGTVGEDGRVGEGRIELAAPDLQPLRMAFPNLPVLLPLLRGPGGAVLTASGLPDALAVHVTAEASDLRFEAQPTVNLSTRRWSGPVTLRHPGAPRLLEQLGGGSTAAWLGDGSFSLLAQVRSDEKRVVLDSFDLGAGALRAAGQLTLVPWAPGGFSVAGQVVAETLPLPSPYPQSPEPLPVALLLGWQAALRLDASQVLVGQEPALQRLSAEVLVKDGVLTLPRVSARAGTGLLAGRAWFAAGSEPPRMEVHGTLTGLALPEAPAEPEPATAIDLTGVLDATLDAAAGGYSPAALLATAAGTASVTVRDGTLTGFDLPALAAALADPDRSHTAARAAQALAGGTTPFTRIQIPLTLQRGTVSAQGALASPAGTAQFTGSVDLLGATVDGRATIRPDMPADAPVLGLRVGGPAIAPIRTPELAGLSLWLAGQP